MLGRTVRCAACDVVLLDYRGKPVEQDVVLCESSIFGACGVILCKDCSNYEEEQIHQHGTNDIPQLLAQYKS